MDVRRLGKWITLCLLCSLSASSLTQTLQCPDLEGAAHALTRNGVFVGDIHGTDQSPAFLSALVCHALAAHKSVIVGIEYPRRYQSELDAFMASTDKESAERALLATEYWNSSYQDGRRSAAVLRMLNQLREFKLGSQSLEVIAYDTGPVRPRAESSEQIDREEASARLLNSNWTDRGPGKYWILFGGNVHARKIAGMPGRLPNQNTDSYEPLGFKLRSWNLLHLNARSQGGHAWNCMARSPTDEAVKCEEIALAGVPGEAIQNYRIELDTRSGAYDGVYHVGRLSASPPAVTNRDK